MHAGIVPWIVFSKTSAFNPPLCILQMMRIHTWTRDRILIFVFWFLLILFFSTLPKSFQWWHSGWECILTVIWARQKTKHLCGDKLEITNGSNIESWHNGCLVVSWGVFKQVIALRKTGKVVLLQMSPLSFWHEISLQWWKHFLTLRLSNVPRIPT